MVAKVPRMPKKRRGCPKCGSRDVMPIVYGYPLPETMAAANRDEVELGGCLVTDWDPTKMCKACGERFGTRPRERRGPVPR